MDKLLDRFFSLVMWGMFVWIIVSRVWGEDNIGRFFFNMPEGGETSILLKEFYNQNIATLVDGLPVFSTPPPVENVPISQERAIGYTNNLTIRIDSIKLLRNDSDFGLGAEAIFAILVTRDNGIVRSSRKLVAPGTGAYPLRTGDEIPLGDFSLQVNHVSDDEQIEVYFVGLESDTIGEEHDFVNLTLDMILDSIVDAVVPVDDGVTRFAVQILTGEALDWWKKQDVLGDYSLTLDKTNNWHQGERHTVRSKNDNLEITYTIMRSTEELQPLSKTALLTVDNRSLHTIQTIYIWPSNSESWHTKIIHPIEPNKSIKLSVEAGIYNLRAETDRSLYWEQSEVNITHDQLWTINR